MALVVNTNVPSIKLQNNLTNVTSKMNLAMERMTTGKKINSATDDAAGLVISKGLETQVSGTQVAKNNVQRGTNLLKTADGNLDAIQSNLIRARDLTLQAMNGGQSVAELQALQDEVQARLNENDRIANGSKFNKFTLFTGDDTKVTLQVGTGATANDKISVTGVFAAAATSDITGGKDLTIGQVYEGARLVQNIIDDSANIIFGANVNEELNEEVIFTIIATGFNKNKNDAESRVEQNVYSAPENKTIEQDRTKSMDYRFEESARAVRNETEARKSFVGGNQIDERDPARYREDYNQGEYEREERFAAERNHTPVQERVPEDDEDEIKPVKKEKKDLPFFVRKFLNKKD